MPPKSNSLAYRPEVPFWHRFKFQPKSSKACCHSNWNLRTGWGSSTKMSHENAGEAGRSGNCTPEWGRARGIRWRTPVRLSLSLSEGSILFFWYLIFFNLPFLTSITVVQEEAALPKCWNIRILGRPWHCWARTDKIKSKGLSCGIKMMGVKDKKRDCVYFLWFNFEMKLFHN